MPAAPKANPQPGASTPNPVPPPEPADRLEGAAKPEAVSAPAPVPIQAPVLAPAPTATNEAKPDVALPVEEGGTKPSAGGKVGQPPGKPAAPPLRQKLPPQSPASAPAKLKQATFPLWLWVFGGIVLLSYLFGSPDRNDSPKPSKSEQSCSKAIEKGLKFIAAGDLVSARSQGGKANAVCSGELAPKATELQEAIAKAEATDKECRRALLPAKKMFESHRLVAARKALNQLNTDCSNGAAGSQLRQQVANAQGKADVALVQVRELLSGNDLTGAEQKIAELERLNREQAEISELRDRLRSLRNAAKDSAKDSAALGAISPPPPPPVRQQVGGKESLDPAATVPRGVAPGRQPENGSVGGQKSEMAKEFLREAWTALEQKRFDAAKTYVESAKRIDPNHPDIVPMQNTIRAREKKVLEQETIIK